MRRQRQVTDEVLREKLITREVAKRRATEEAVEQKTRARLLEQIEQALKERPYPELQSTFAKLDYRYKFIDYDAMKMNFDKPENGSGVLAEILDQIIKAQRGIELGRRILETTEDCPSLLPMFLDMAFLTNASSVDWTDENVNMDTDVFTWQQLEFLGYFLTVMRRYFCNE